LLALALLTAALTLFSLINLLRIGVGEDGVPLFVLGLVNDILGAIFAATVFFARRSAMKWFYASAGFSLATVPIMKVEHPEFPTGMLIVMFVIMAAICGVVWSVLKWKREALDQPIRPVSEAAE
jgi:hypothetical protein